ncbi:RluA family pseudouridine synthase [Bythopirellula polymerisocia]|uniref:Pseudouridine synthase n=1 Tax=Bythopirellula polymerisocia TaxID=2528003 RepID=A0A5C6CTN0_9BACT|nr:RluA family pseudouridine synthase [Bythopirellula polymerisocia]TWU26099.1 Pseudouridine synthase [Bythopirellula polymerisocia]
MIPQSEPGDGDEDQDLVPDEFTSVSENQPVQFLVPDESADQRLDVFLTAQFIGTSRARIRRSIDQGAASVDGVAQKAAYRISSGENVKFFLSPQPASGPEPEPIPLDILYEDDEIAVVNKPPRMVVHPARGHWSGTLASALIYHFGQLSQQGGATRPGIVHRLDRDTSGVMVIAKNDLAHQNLSEQFQNRTVEKEYLAIVQGSPDRDRDLIDLAVANHPSQREKKALLPDHPTSRAAQTFYEVEERFRGLALIRAFPKTGRTHQIRLHLNSLRCPVLCDKLYGGRTQLTLGELRNITRSKELAVGLSPEEVLLNRQALHAQVLRITHPASGDRLEFRCEIPPDLESLLLLLRQSNESR